MAWRPNFAVGVKRLIDAQMNFVQNGNPVYLRTDNFPSEQAQEWDQLGFAISPSGTTTLHTGTGDVQIWPQPAVSMLSMNQIAFSGGMLRLGARRIEISDTWVSRYARQKQISNPSLVFENALGLVVDGLLMEVVSVLHEEAFGGTITWTIICNAPEAVNSVTQ